MVGEFGVGIVALVSFTGNGAVKLIDFSLKSNKIGGFLSLSSVRTFQTMLILIEHQTLIILHLLLQLFNEITVQLIFISQYLVIAF